jgi:hypothetical protein
MKKKPTGKVAAKHCRPPYHISEAGHLLSTKGTRKAGKVLSKEGKAAKRKRIAKGCLNGPAGTFQLSRLQKRFFPKALQMAIIEKHRRMGKTIIP